MTRLTTLFIMLGSCYCYSLSPYQVTSWWGVTSGICLHEKNNLIWFRTIVNLFVLGLSPFLALLNTKHQEMYKKLNWYNVVHALLEVTNISFSTSTNNHRTVLMPASTAQPARISSELSARRRWQSKESTAAIEWGESYKLCVTSNRACPTRHLVGWWQFNKMQNELAAI